MVFIDLRCKSTQRWMDDAENFMTRDNPKRPCVHFDPILDPRPAGETVSFKGRILFHEGNELPKR